MKFFREKKTTKDILVLPHEGANLVDEVEVPDSFVILCKNQKKIYKAVISILELLDKNKLVPKNVYHNNALYKELREILTTLKGIDNE